MLLMPADWACEMGLPLETGIPGLWNNAVPINSRSGEDTVFSSTLSMGQRDQCQSEGATLEPSTSQTGHIS